MATERDLVEAIKEEVRGEECSVSWHVGMRKGETYGADNLKAVYIILRERVCGSCFHGLLVGAFSSMLGLDSSSLLDTIYEEQWFEDKTEMAKVRDGSCEIH